MTREEIVNSMSLQDAIQVLKDTNCYGTMDIAKTVILKALEQEPRWIPIREKPPEEYADVICCTDAKEVFVASYLGKLNDGSECFDDDNGMMWEGDVIAWMPYRLPEPFEGNTK